MLEWKMDKRNPVIIPGDLHPGYDDSRAGAPHVIQREDHYLMVYWGSDKDGKNYILRARSPLDRPNDWKPLGEPLIGPQPSTSYNCAGPAFPFLLPASEDRWLLYLTAWGQWEDGKVPNTTGVAVSDDGGENWRYHSEHPVIPLDRNYDAEATGSVWVLQENGRFRMYYTAIGRYCRRPEGAQTGHGDTIPEIGIAYAESDDGLHWEKPLDNFLVVPRGFLVRPYEYICSKPCIVKGREKYALWVNTFGTAYRVHRLRSPDGLQWEWSERRGPDGELGVGGEGAFDDYQRSYPCVVRRGDQLHCWFTGNGFGATGIGYATADGGEALLRGGR
jgi:hypothetical protein